MSTDVAAEPTRAVCARRPNLGHRVLYPGTIDRRRSALDDVTTLAVVKGAFKLDYGCFFVREEQRRSIADGSPFRPEAQGKQLKKSKQSLAVRLATATGGKWGTNGRPFMTRQVKAA